MAKVKAQREKKCPTPPKSTILNNFDHWYAEYDPCPGALLAFFGAYGHKPVFAWYLDLD